MSERMPALGRFSRYIDRLSACIGGKDRRALLEAYLKGLLLPGSRKSVEPMAARLDPAHVSALHQSLHHFVAQSPWDAGALVDTAGRYWLGDRAREVLAWVVEETAAPKRGSRSVGVARQYSRSLGGLQNCQVAVTVSAVTPGMVVPCWYRLYLPSSHARMPRSAGTGAPTPPHRARWQLAVDGVDHMLSLEMGHAPVVANVAYGGVPAFRRALGERGLSSIVGVGADTPVLPDRVERKQSAAVDGHDGPRRSRSLPAWSLGRTLPAGVWRTHHRLDGRASRSRLSLLPLPPGDYAGSRALLMEWPPGSLAPTRYWLCTLPRRGASTEQCLRLLSTAGRVESAFLRMRDTLGLHHYEGRGWLGYHHHGALCIAAYLFLSAEQRRAQPVLPAEYLAVPPRPRGFRPRGSPG